MNLNVKIKRLHPTVTLPEYASAAAAGMDLHAAIDAPTVIPAHIRVRIPCGFAIAPERNDIAALYPIVSPNKPRPNLTAANRQL